MSRIGKLPISLPTGILVTVNDKNLVTVKGPKGELKQQIDTAINVTVDSNIVHIVRHTEQKNHKALHGLYRSLLFNMVKGVSEGYEIIQELVGVGYKASNQGQLLDMSLGYSHHIYFELPIEVTVETITEKGKNPIIKLRSIDKQLLGQVASKIRSLRKPEPYKGKGIKYDKEVLRRKAGKSASSK